MKEALDMGFGKAETVDKLFGKLAGCFLPGMDGFLDNLDLRGGG